MSTKNTPLNAKAVPLYFHFLPVSFPKNDDAGNGTRTLNKLILEK
jgi:hypothetical protein